MILLSETMNRSPEFTVEEFISKHLPDYFNPEVFQYFGREIMSTHPKEVQDFFIKASFLDLMEPMFTDELLGMKNTGDILKDHVRQSLFVESFYVEKKGWVFRSHPLLRNFLKAKFETTIGKEEQKNLYLKAAELYEARNESVSAVKFFLEARAYPQALSIIEHIGMEWGGSCIFNCG